MNRRALFRLFGGAAVAPLVAVIPEVPVGPTPGLRFIAELPHGIVFRAADFPSAGTERIAALMRYWTEGAARRGTC